MKVHIIDYGLSNLLSVRRAVEYLGHQAVLVKTATELEDACAVILPGVGAFKDGMAGLSRQGFTQPLRDMAKQGTTILGICLGMQMLFDASEEFGLHEGLGLIPGRVVRIPGTGLDGNRQLVPQVGWNGLLPPENRCSFASPLLNGIAREEDVYFVHSYEAVPENAGHRLADCSYGGRRICAACGNRRVFGTQFHPEKSGDVGLRILGNWLAFAGVLDSKCM